MSKELLLYILLFIARVIVFSVIWNKYGWKAAGWAWLYAMFTAFSELQEVV